MMYPLVRPILFRLDPENAHRRAVTLLRWAGVLTPVRLMLSKWYGAPQKPVEAFGLRFKNPVGMAAGFDKDGMAWRGLACLGFGHVEIGTVTPLPQPGNPRPRLFRLPKERALINRLGFPGRGADFVARQLKAARPPGLVLGVNIGMNRATPLGSASGDYVSLFRTFAPLADYIAVNVSSPNTAGLRRLQEQRAFEGLLSALAGERHSQQANLQRRLPLLVKLAPDLADSELDEALEAITRCGIDGVIATNTTTSRPNIESPLANEPGGLSGTPLREMSTAMVRKIHRRTEGKLLVIGVGGIMSAADVQEKLDAGAGLVQLYTGLIYEGPGLIRRILLEL